MSETKPPLARINELAAIAEKELSQIHRATDEELVEAIAEAAETAGTCLEYLFDAPTADRFGRIEDQLYRELRSRGPAARDKILGLLDRPNVFVRTFAAIVALEFHPDEAEKTLQAIIDRREAANATMEARMTLREWRRGALKLPLPQHVK